MGEYFGYGFEKWLERNENWLVMIPALLIFIFILLPAIILECPTFSCLTVNNILGIIVGVGVLIGVMCLLMLTINPNSRRCDDYS